MLKYELETVTDDLAPFYTKDEATGRFRLQAEGVVPLTEHEATKAKLSEFRTTNNALKRQLEELSDFEKVVGTDGKVTKDGVKTTIENLVQARTQQMRQQYDGTLAEKEKALVSAGTKLGDLLISDAVKAAALSHGVVATAVDDVVARARAQFKVDEEFNVVSVTTNGDASGNPLTIATFVAGLKENAPHLFARSEGTGSFMRSRSTSPAQHERSSRSRLADFVRK